MALTAAQRQKRYERHKQGDHSLCDPARDCTGTRPATAPVSRPSPEPIPAAPVPPPECSASRFGPRGMELWEAMSEVQMGPAHRVLLAEACRMADRLDRFERVLSGGKWFFERRDEDERVEIVIDQVLSEARQYASALKVIIAQLEERPKAASEAPSRKAAGRGLADLTARIESRRRTS